MRILVTENGKQVEKEIEIEVYDNSLRNRTAYSCMGPKHSLFLKPKVELPKTIKAKKSKRIFINGENKKGTNTDRTNFTSPNLSTIPSEKPKKLVLSKKSTRIPKAIAVLYENEDLYAPINTINSKVASQKSDGLEGFKYKKENITLAEIVGAKRVNDLKLTLIEKNRMRDKLAKIDENCFRTTYNNYTDLEKLDSILKYKSIKPTHLNLIKFISNERDKLSGVSMKRFVDFDHQKQFKMNKICQTVFRQQQEDKIKAEAVKNMLDYRHNLQKIEVDNNLKQTGINFKNSENIFSKYNRRVDDKERYKDNYKSMKNRYWSHFDYKRLCGKNYAYTLTSKYDEDP